jgi:hypothetical protein
MCFNKHRLMKLLRPKWGEKKMYLYVSRQSTRYISERRLGVRQDLSERGAQDNTSCRYGEPKLVPRSSTLSWKKKQAFIRNSFVLKNKRLLPGSYITNDIFILVMLISLLYLWLCTNATCFGFYIAILRQFLSTENIMQINGTLFQNVSIESNMYYI